MLGLWLVSGINRVQALLFGILAYTGLAIISGRLAASGVPDCGCMGALPSNPWIIFGLDVLLALGLTATLYLSTERVVLRQGFRQFLATSASIVLIVAAIALVAAGRYGSLEAAMRNWQGHSLHVPASVEAIQHDEDRNARASIDARNDGDAPLRIIGSDVCCGARLESPLPIALESGENKTLIVLLNCNRQTPLVVTLWVEFEGKLKKQRVVVSCRNPS